MHKLRIVNARRMRESYCNHPVCLSVCLSVTAVALTYYVCVTDLAYQCSLRCKQTCFKLDDFAEKLPFPSYSFFSLLTAKRTAI